jgi:hypothetical protein
MTAFYDNSNPTNNSRINKPLSDISPKTLANLAGLLDILIQIDLMRHSKDSVQTKTILKNIIKRDSNEQ